MPSLVNVRCNHCSRELPAHRVHRLKSNQVVCDYCLVKHFHALEVLGGAVPHGCQECHRTWEEIRSRNPLELVEGRVYVVPKDGILQMLCESCITPYTAKRADLYGGTQYGKELNL